MINRHLLLVLTLASAAPAQVDGSLAVGRVVRFELDDTAPRFTAPGLAEWAESSPGRRFSLAPDSGGLHTVELKSALCDSYLIVRKPDGKVVAETGFGPYGEHARLEFEFEAGVEYLVDACSFYGFGTLQIAVHNGKIAQPQGAVRAQEVLGDATTTLAARRRALGDDHERVLAAYADLGNASWRFGRYRKALAAYEAFLDILERRAAPDDERMAFAYEQIGAQHMALGELDEAEAAYEKALAFYEAAGKPAAAALTLSGISHVLKARGEFEEALDFDRRALDLLTKEEGGDPRFVAIGHNNIATSFSQLALPWHVEAGLELPDGSTATAAEIADLDLSGCGIFVLEADRARSTDGLAAVTRALLHAGARAVVLAGDDAPRMREFVAAVAAGSASPRAAARTAGMAVVGDIE